MLVLSSFKIVGDAAVDHSAAPLEVILGGVAVCHLKDLPVRRMSLP